MHYFKKTFLWIIILAAIGGYSYIDFEKTKIRDEERDLASKLLPFAPSQVMAVHLLKDDREIVLERWEEGWKIVKPVNAAADGKSVEDFLGYVTDSRNDSEYVMDANPTAERLAEFGLEKPSLSVTLKVGKELKEYTMFFGDRAPTMGVAFARLDGGKPVYRVLADARAQADKDVYYFRDKKILKLNPIMVDQLSITSEKMSMRLKLPDSGKWEIEKPVKARANHLRVFEVMSVFANAEIKSFLDDVKTDGDLSRFGLDKPAVTLLFWQSGDADPTVKLSIGNRNPAERGYYSMITGRENPFILSEEAFNEIPKDPNELRSRELMFFEPTELVRVELREPERSLVWVKGGEGEWHKDTPTGRQLDFNEVKELLDEFKALQIEDFLPDDGNYKQYGLEPPRVQVLFFRKDEAVPFILGIGNKSPRGYVYARTSEGGIIAEIQAGIAVMLKNRMDTA